ncbi:MAG: SpoIID/LytB protein [Marmoricola sp.]|nr:SpoIID/LytB protein [Marmoricola sp.]
MPAASRTTTGLRARRLVAGVLGTTALGAALAGPVGSADASVTVAQAYAVPADGVLHLTGHGFGHGHGMSQYGAQGAAKQGLTAAQVLRFYYPGTTLTSLGGTIRVLISADTDGDVRVAPASGLRVRQVAGGTSYALPTTAGITSWRLRTVAGATRLEFAKAGWHAYRPGGKALSGDAEFHRSGPVTLQVAGTTRVYRGALRLAAGRTVDVLGLDNYVRGVVPREMPASWMPAALQAQAVAARTYAAFDRAAHPTRAWQTCDTTACQVYGGFSAEDARSNAAVAATAAQVVTYAGKPAFTQFGSSSGGWLTDGGQPYLVAKPDPYDATPGNPVHTWTTTVTRATLQRLWPAVGTLQRVTVTQRDGHGEWSGRVEKLVLTGTAGTVTVGGPTFRSSLGLRSTWFAFG